MDSLNVAEVSDPKKLTLSDLDWMRVRMFSVQGNTVRVVTDEGPAYFEFPSEAEAKKAVDEWFAQQRKPYG